METPGTLSSSFTSDENITIAGYKIQADTPIFVFVHQLHHNPQQWIDHLEYNPDRFDKDSPYFLTPGGEKRNQNSFCPFLLGSRVCSGKPFAEMVIRLVVPALI